ncbi:transmembrane amino acid transporter protein [Dictyocaulus viviparus]|uniref:Transmembrane amino acid transporter protein n=1 Tax=Dictyocaulus viviparus TaxID=29172 RepID=A0A0D8Y6T1_DICVI|nr:transmembrane amino acid transporter protein [Dictyocaulus viviparus]
MIAVCAVLTKYTCHFLSKISILSGKHSYETLALKALGPTGRRIVELCMLSFLVSSIVAFMVMIGDIGPHIVADYLELEAPTQRLRTLIMILEALPVVWDGKWSVHVEWWRPAGFLTWYAGVGLFGYVAFFSRTLHGDVLVELESSFLTQLLKLAFMLSIAISIPLMLFPARNTLFNLVLRPSNCELPVSNAMRFSTFHVLTFVILLFNMTIALLVPNVEFVLGLTGSLVGSLVNIIIPSVLFIAISDNRKHRSVSHAKVCVVAGCFILLVSTWATLQVERTTNVVEKPMPKDGVIDKPVLRTLQKLEEKVLDANLNISAKLDSIVDLAAIGKDRDAANLLVEMKKQRREQKDLIRKQKEIVQELHRFVVDDGKGKLIGGDDTNKKDMSIRLGRNPSSDKEEQTFLGQKLTSQTIKVVGERETGVNMVYSAQNINQSYSLSI